MSFLMNIQLNFPVGPRVLYQFIDELTLSVAVQWTPVYLTELLKNHFFMFIIDKGRGKEGRGIVMVNIGNRQETARMGMTKVMTYDREPKIFTAEWKKDRESRSYLRQLERRKTWQ